MTNIVKGTPESMTSQSEQAAIEIRIDWEHRGTRHRNRQHFGKFNFWRDILPGSLSIKLPDSDGEWVSEQFPAGELVPPWHEHNIHRVRKNELHLQRRHGPPVTLHAGRHYPRYIAAGTADIFSGNVHPMRLLEMDASTVTIDLNHPLARTPLVVAACIQRRDGVAAEHGGRCNDAVMDILDAGAGLEALHAPGSTDFFSGNAFARLDPRPDARFYENARLVPHVDSTASAQIGEIYARMLEPGMQVLDLMSSQVSHLPEAPADLHLTGLGMNAEELAQNPRLHQRIVHDLNAQPALPLPDNRFDAAICSVSIEYLIEPVAVLQELGRVLKPGAAAIITFSDRWFPTKVIELWTELHPFERMGLVLEYFREAGCFGALRSESLRGLPRPIDDKYTGQLAHSDPVFAVWGYTEK
jgi:SAM-dependent methyltransferase